MGGGGGRREERGEGERREWKVGQEVRKGERREGREGSGREERGV